MNTLAGVDEAGLGPILGPLVVAGVVMQGPPGADPWRKLQRHVSRKKQEKGKVRVADSKKVNQGPHGTRRLEETALVFWAAWKGELPACLGDWLEQLDIDVAPLRRCPWYEDLSLSLPRVADTDWIELQAELVRRALAQAELSLLDIAVRLVDVEEWNGLIADTDNKSRAHFHAYSEVIARLVGKVPMAQGDESAHLVADRCGGRMHYGGDLRRLFPGTHVQTLHEEPAVSQYRLRGERGTIDVTFSEQGEERAFPTALASCFAKYTRELMVEVINNWFGLRVPGLSPTAGYYVDGHRWLDEVMPHLPTLRVPTERLVRVR